MKPASLWPWKMRLSCYVINLRSKMHELQLHLQATKALESLYSARGRLLSPVTYGGSEDHRSDAHKPSLEINIAKGTLGASTDFLSDVPAVAKWDGGVEEEASAPKLHTAASQQREKKTELGHPVDWRWNSVKRSEAYRAGNGTCFGDEWTNHEWRHHEPELDVALIDAMPVGNTTALKLKLPLEFTYHIVHVLLGFLELAWSPA